MDLISAGHNRSYEDFKKQISPSVKPVFDTLREYCLSLMEPQHDSILIKIKSDRKEPQKDIVIKPSQNLDEIKNLLLDAYNAIH
ncbi:MAG: hypothetical protein E6L02_07320 [Thaumarchaeota archaeon]|nr:MAG: hypothetical protein E6L02_07320 [Nitrososphaerota archaeon]